ncbi:APH(3') family aminoglycoside O-phosphotransferase [Nocardiopsis coralliicola]
MVRRRLRRRYLLYSWTRMPGGEPGAEVWRLSGRAKLFAKIGDPAELSAEAERAAWLSGAGAAAPEPVEQGERDGVGWLVSTAVPGRPVSGEWPAHLRAPVVAAFARAARRLHDLAAGGCPFDGRLDTAVPLARKRVAAGLVESGSFDAERRGEPPEQVLAALEASRPDERADDIVVCHGDLTPDNVLIDPATLEWTGFVDTGRLGTADRHRDLSLALRDLAGEPYGPAFARAFAVHYGDDLIDPDRLAYYRLLDEFF